MTENGYSIEQELSKVNWYLPPNGAFEPLPDMSVPWAPRTRTERGPHLQDPIPSFLKGGTRLLAADGKFYDLSEYRQRGPIVELFCGTAYPSRRYASQFPDREFIAIDKTKPGHPVVDSPQVGSIKEQPRNLHLLEMGIEETSTLPPELVGTCDMVFGENYADLNYVQERLPGIAQTIKILLHKGGIFWFDCGPTSLVSYKERMATALEQTGNWTIVRLLPGQNPGIDERAWLITNKASLTKPQPVFAILNE